MFLMLLAYDLPATLDRLKMLRMIVVHDLHKLVTGDVLVYDQRTSDGMALDATKVKNVKDNGQLAMEKLRTALPPDLSEEVMSLWSEFAAAETPEAKMAKSLDKLHPLLQNLFSDGSDFKKCDGGASYEKEMGLLKVRVNSWALRA